jgi:hypothetical protein
MSGDTDSVEVMAQPATETEVFLKEWAKETIKRNIPLLNDVLRSLLTLSTALSGASFLAQTVTPAFRVGAAICFLGAMLASLRGILPYEGTGSFLVPEEIRIHKEKAQESKLACVKLAAGLIIFGIVAAAIGTFLPRS